MIDSIPHEKYKKKSVNGRSSILASRFRAPSLGYSILIAYLCVFFFFPPQVWAQQPAQTPANQKPAVNQNPAPAPEPEIPAGRPFKDNDLTGPLPIGPTGQDDKSKSKPVELTERDNLRLALHLPTLMESKLAPVRISGMLALAQDADRAKSLFGPYVACANPFLVDPKDVNLDELDGAIHNAQTLLANFISAHEDQLNTEKYNLAPVAAKIDVIKTPSGTDCQPVAWAMEAVKPKSPTEGGAKLAKDLAGDEAAAPQIAYFVELSKIPPTAPISNTEIDMWLSWLNVVRRWRNLLAEAYHYQGDRSAIAALKNLEISSEAAAKINTIFNNGVLAANEANAAAKKPMQSNAYDMRFLPCDGTKSKRYCFVEAKAKPDLLSETTLVQLQAGPKNKTGEIKHGYVAHAHWEAKTNARFFELGAAFTRLRDSSDKVKLPSACFVNDKEGKPQPKPDLAVGIDTFNKIVRTEAASCWLNNVKEGIAELHEKYRLGQEMLPPPPDVENLYQTAASETDRAVKDYFAYLKSKSPQAGETIDLIQIQILQLLQQPYEKRIVEGEKIRGQAFATFFGERLAFWFHSHQDEFERNLELPDDIRSAWLQNQLGKIYAYSLSGEIPLSLKTYLLPFESAERLAPIFKGQTSIDQFWEDGDYSRKWDGFLENRQKRGNFAPVVQEISNALFKYPGFKKGCSHNDEADRLATAWVRRMMPVAEQAVIADNMVRFMQNHQSSNELMMNSVPGVKSIIGRDFEAAEKAIKDRTKAPACTQIDDGFGNAEGDHLYLKFRELFDPRKGQDYNLSVKKMIGSIFANQEEKLTEQLANEGYRDELVNKKFWQEVPLQGRKLIGDAAAKPPSEQGTTVISVNSTATLARAIIKRGVEAAEADVTDPSPVHEHRIKAADGFLNWLNGNGFVAKDEYEQATKEYAQEIFGKYLKPLLDSRKLIDAKDTAALQKWDAAFDRALNEIKVREVILQEPKRDVILATITEREKKDAAVEEFFKNIDLTFGPASKPFQQGAVANADNWVRFALAAKSAWFDTLAKPYDDALICSAFEARAVLATQSALTPFFQSFGKAPSKHDSFAPRTVEYKGPKSFDGLGDRTASAEVMLTELKEKILAGWFGRQIGFFTEPPDKKNGEAAVALLNDIDKYLQSASATLRDSVYVGVPTADFIAKQRPVILTQLRSLSLCQKWQARLSESRAKLGQAVASSNADQLKAVLPEARQLLASEPSELHNPANDALVKQLIAEVEDRKLPENLFPSFGVFAKAVNDRLLLVKMPQPDPAKQIKDAEELLTRIDNNLWLVENYEKNGFKSFNQVMKAAWVNLTEVTQVKSTEAPHRIRARLVDQSQATKRLIQEAKRRRDAFSSLQRILQNYFGAKGRELSVAVALLKTIEKVDGNQLWAEHFTDQIMRATWDATRTQENPLGKKMRLPPERVLEDLNAIAKLSRSQYGVSAERAREHLEDLQNYCQVGLSSVHVQPGFQSWYQSTLGEDLKSLRGKRSEAELFIAKPSSEDKKIKPVAGAIRRLMRVRQIVAKTPDEKREAATIPTIIPTPVVLVGPPAPVANSAPAALAPSWLDKAVDGQTSDLLEAKLGDAAAFCAGLTGEIAPVRAAIASGSSGNLPYATTTNYWTVLQIASDVFHNPHSQFAPLFVAGADGKVDLAKAPIWFRNAPTDEFAPGDLERGTKLAPRDANLIYGEAVGEPKVSQKLVQFLTLPQITPNGIRAALSGADLSGSIAKKIAMETADQRLLGLNRLTSKERFLVFGRIREYLEAVMLTVAGKDKFNPAVEPLAPSPNVNGPSVWPALPPPTGPFTLNEKLSPSDVKVPQTPDIKLNDLTGPLPLEKKVTTGPLFSTNGSETLQYQTWKDAMFRDLKVWNETKTSAGFLSSTVFHYLSKNIFENWVERLPYRLDDKGIFIPGQGNLANRKPVGLAQSKNSFTMRQPDQKYQVIEEILALYSAELIRVQALVTEKAKAVERDRANLKLAYSDSKLADLLEPKFADWNTKKGSIDFVGSADFNQMSEAVFTVFIKKSPEILEDGNLVIPSAKQAAQTTPAQSQKTSLANFKGRTATERFAIINRIFDIYRTPQMASLPVLKNADIHPFRCDPEQAKDVVCFELKNIAKPVTEDQQIVQFFFDTYLKSVDADDASAPKPGTKNVLKWRTQCQALAAQGELCYQRSMKDFKLSFVPAGERTNQAEILDRWVRTLEIEPNAKLAFLKKVAESDDKIGHLWDIPELTSLDKLHDQEVYKQVKGLIEMSDENAKASPETGTYPFFVALLNHLAFHYGSKQFHYGISANVALGKNFIPRMPLDEDLAGFLTHLIAVSGLDLRSFESWEKLLREKGSVGELKQLAASKHFALVSVRENRLLSTDLPAITTSPISGPDYSYHVMPVFDGERDFCLESKCIQKFAHNGRFKDSFKAYYQTATPYLNYRVNENPLDNMPAYKAMVAYKGNIISEWHLDTAQDISKNSGFKSLKDSVEKYQWGRGTVEGKDYRDVALTRVKDILLFAETAGLQSTDLPDAKVVHDLTKMRQAYADFRNKVINENLFENPTDRTVIFNGKGNGALNTVWSHTSHSNITTALEKFAEQMGYPEDQISDLVYRASLIDNSYRSVLTEVLLAAGSVMEQKLNSMAAEGPERDKLRKTLRVMDDFYREEVLKRTYYQIVQTNTDNILSKLEKECGKDVNAMLAMNTQKELEAYWEDGKDIAQEDGILKFVNEKMENGEHNETYRILMQLKNRRSSLQEFKEDWLSPAMEGLATAALVMMVAGTRSPGIGRVAGSLTVRLLFMATMGYTFYDQVVDQTMQDYDWNGSLARLTGIKDTQIEGRLPVMSDDTAAQLPGLRLDLLAKQGSYSRWGFRLFSAAMTLSIFAPLRHNVAKGASWALRNYWTSSYLYLKLQTSLSRLKIGYGWFLKDLNKALPKSNISAGTTDAQTFLKGRVVNQFKEQLRVTINLGAADAVGETLSNIAPNVARTLDARLATAIDAECKRIGIDTAFLEKNVAGDVLTQSGTVAEATVVERLRDLHRIRQQLRVVNPGTGIAISFDDLATSLVVSAEHFAQTEVNLLTQLTGLNEVIDAFAPSIRALRGAHLLYYTRARLPILMQYRELVEKSRGPIRDWLDRISNRFAAGLNTPGLHLPEGFAYQHPQFSKLSIEENLLVAMVDDTHPWYAQFSNIGPTRLAYPVIEGKAVEFVIPDDIVKEVMELRAVWDLAPMPRGLRDDSFLRIIRAVEKQNFRALGKELLEPSRIVSVGRRIPEVSAKGTANLSPTAARPGGPGTGPLTGTGEALPRLAVERRIPTDLVPNNCLRADSRLPDRVRQGGRVRPEVSQLIAEDGGWGRANFDALLQHLPAADKREAYIYIERLLTGNYSSLEIESALGFHLFNDEIEGHLIRAYVVAGEIARAEELAIANMRRAKIEALPMSQSMFDSCLKLVNDVDPLPRYYAMLGKPHELAWDSAKLLQAQARSKAPSRMLGEASNAIYKAQGAPMDIDGFARLIGVGPEAFNSYWFIEALDGASAQTYWLNSRLSANGLEQLNRVKAIFDATTNAADLATSRLLLGMPRQVNSGELLDQVLANTVNREALLENTKLFRDDLKRRFDLNFSNRERYRTAIENITKAARAQGLTPEQLPDLILAR